MKKLKVVIALYFIFGFILLSLYFHNWKSSNVEIVQPIFFSHKKHSGEKNIECNFCHILAKESQRADVPSLKKCMDCHITIAKDSIEIKKLYSFWEKRQPIQWLKVYSLPSFVYFSHKRHIKRGIDCVVCHGDVKNMERVKKVRSLKMGWCVGCHREFGGTDDCIACHK